MEFNGEQYWYNTNETEDIVENNQVFGSKDLIVAAITFPLSKPEIINSDQGGHFTNPDYLKLLEDAGVKISMDGKGQDRAVLSHAEI